MSQQLPFFVYGTLRRGQGNHPIVDGLLADVRDAELGGHVLYENGLPYIGACGGGGTVTGDLLIPHPGDYDEVLHRLDRLEGFRPPHDGLYVRIACPVRFAGAPGEPWGSCQAWVYHGGGRFHYHPSLVVPGGDWAKAREMHAGSMAR